MGNETSGVQQGAWLRVVQSVDPALPVGLQVTIPVGAGIVGRSTTCDICLPGNTVSRRHARLRDDPWSIELLTSTNSLFVDGVPTTGPSPVAAERTFQLGGVVLVLVSESGTSPVLTPLEEPVLLVVRRDGEAATAYSGSKLLSMGSREARALAELIDGAGAPVHRWDLVQALGLTANLDKVISMLRKSLREAFEQEDLPMADFARALETERCTPDALVKLLLQTRRGHGYLLALPPHRVRVEVV